MDWLLPITDIRDLGISPDHRVNWSCLIEGWRWRLARKPRIPAYPRNIRHMQIEGARCRSTAKAWAFPMQSSWRPGRVQGGHACASESAVHVLIVTPALGAVNWAARNKTWIIEDDYDGECRYVSRPLPALKSLDRDGQVLYAGASSEVLFPSIRLAYLVVPATRVERFDQISQTLSGGSPGLPRPSSRHSSPKDISRAISDECGSSMPSVGKRQRPAWKACWGKRANRFTAGGMHLILRLRGKRSDRRLVPSIRSKDCTGKHWRIGQCGMMAPRACFWVSRILTLGMPPRNSEGGF